MSGYSIPPNSGHGTAVAKTTGKKKIYNQRKKTKQNKRKKEKRKKESIEIKWKEMENDWKRKETGNMKGKKIIKRKKTLRYPIEIIKQIIS